MQFIAISGLCSRQMQSQCRKVFEKYIWQQWQQLNSIAKHCTAQHGTDTFQSNTIKFNWMWCDATAKIVHNSHLGRNIMRTGNRNCCIQCIQLCTLWSTTQQTSTFSSRVIFFSFVFYIFTVIELNRITDEMWVKNEKKNDSSERL